jgi:hypothetical protein
MKEKISNRLLALLSSRKFFVGLLVFFVFESVWIAISARYPMAFDEEFHLGVIKLYAHNHFSPFFAAHPAGADAFGGVARDPSYLYHYLMSFPFRLIAAFTDSQTIQVIFLRLINVALVASGVIAFRALLLRAKLSRALAHAVLAIFTLIPIVPLLAGQINYDNLLILTVPLTMILALSILSGLGKRKIYIGQSVLLLSVLFLESLVKYPFLPIALAVGGFVLVYGLRAFWGRWSELGKTLAENYRQLSGLKVAGLLIFLILSLGLFVQRYGVNMVKYHTALPNCATVLTETQCQANGPWARNQEYVAQKTNIDHNPVSYANLWFHDMLLRSVFAINGPFSDFTNYFPLWIPQATAEAMCIVSVLLAILFARKIFGGHTELQLFAVTFVVYIVILAYTNYKSYLHTGEPVAINGRYLLLVMPLVLTVAAVAFVQFLRKFKWTWFKPWLGAAIILLFLQGGGFVTYVLQSDASWYWQGNQAVNAMNNAARSVLRPFIYKKPAERFLKYE